jgi:hypothetical protein
MENPTQDEKYWSQKQALYVKQAPELFIERNTVCQSCAFYHEKSCEIVNGIISNTGYCRFWEQLEEVTEPSESLENLAQEGKEIVLEQFSISSVVKEQGELFEKIEEFKTKQFADSEEEEKSIEILFDYTQ